MSESGISVWVSSRHGTFYLFVDLVQMNWDRTHRERVSEYLQDLPYISAQSPYVALEYLFRFELATTHGIIRLCDSVSYDLNTPEGKRGFAAFIEGLAQEA